MDFSLLPPFDKVAQYFYATVYAGSAKRRWADAKAFCSPAPCPPEQLRGETGQLSRAV